MPAPLALIAMIMIVFVAIRMWRRRRSGSPPLVGPGAAGATYAFLNEDKRAALEIVIEERAAYKDPEDRDGNLPDLYGKYRDGDSS
jgi:hypothetical protein